jgi:hypothetical protein
MLVFVAAVKFRVLYVKFMNYPWQIVPYRRFLFSNESFLAKINAMKMGFPYYNTDYFSAKKSFYAKKGLIRCIGSYVLHGRIFCIPNRMIHSH